MIKTIVGSQYVGSLIKKADANVLKILGSLTAVNSSEIQANIRGLNDLNPFIETKEFLNGGSEQFTNSRIFATDDGEYADSPTYNETYEQWNFLRAGYRLKDMEFTLSLLEDAYERGSPLESIVSDRIQAVSEWYMDEYLPNTIYSSLMKIPSTAQALTYRAAPYGLLKDTVVDRFMLKPGRTKLSRNNYKAVKSATAGLTIEDLEQIITEFTDFSDISDGNLVIYATRGTIAKTRTTIAADINKDVFNRTGKPSTTILGVQFVENDRIPPGKMLLIDGNAKRALVHVVSPKKDLQGLAAVKDIGNGFDKLETVKDFVGSYWRVMPEGRAIRGRHQFMWIDLLTNAKNAALDMSDTGIADLRSFDSYLESRWKRPVV